MSFAWSNAANQSIDEAAVRQLRKKLLSAKSVQERGFNEAAIDAIEQVAHLPARKATFELVRRIKPLSARLGIKVTNGAIQPVLQLLYEQLGRPGSFTDMQSEWVDSMRRCQRPVGSGAIDVAAIRCRDPATWPAVYDEPESNHLLALCRELASQSADGVFFLSNRSAQAVVGFPTQPVAGRRMRMIVEHGYLELVELSTARRAPRFRLTKEIPNFNHVPE